MAHSSAVGACRFVLDAPTVVYQTLIDQNGTQDSSSPLNLCVELCKTVGDALQKKASSLNACIVGAVRRIDGAPLLVWQPDHGAAEETHGTLAPLNVGSVFHYELSGLLLNIKVHRKYLPVSKCHGDAPFVFTFLLKPGDGVSPLVVVTSPFISASKEPRSPASAKPDSKPKRMRAPPSTKPVAAPLSADDLLISSAFSQAQPSASSSSPLPVSAAAASSAASGPAQARQPMQSTPPASVLSAGSTGSKGLKRGASSMEEAPATHAASRKAARTRTSAGASAAAAPVAHAAPFHVPELLPKAVGELTPWLAASKPGPAPVPSFLLDEAPEAGLQHSGPRAVSPGSATGSLSSLTTGSRSYSYGELELDMELAGLDGLGSGFSEGITPASVMEARPVGQAAPAIVAPQPAMPAAPVPWGFASDPFGMPVALPPGQPQGQWAMPASGLLPSASRWMIGAPGARRDSVSAPPLPRKMSTGLALGMGMGYGLGQGDLAWDGLAL